MKFLLCTFGVAMVAIASMDSETVLSPVPSAIANVDELPALLRENAPPGNHGVDVEQLKAFARKCMHEERETKNEERETKNAIMRLDPETKMMMKTNTERVQICIGPVRQYDNLDCTRSSPRMSNSISGRLFDSVRATAGISSTNADQAEVTEDSSFSQAF